MAPTIGRLALNNGFHGSIPGDLVALPPQNIQHLLPFLICLIVCFCIIYFQILITFQNKSQFIWRRIAVFIISADNYFSTMFSNTIRSNSSRMSSFSSVFQSCSIRLLIFLYCPIFSSR